MATTLADLITPATRTTWRDRLLAAAQGRYHVTAKGSGSGKLTTSGTPTTAADVVVAIVASGEIGAATYKVSTDGGVTFGATATVSAALIAIGSTGVSVKFTVGGAGTGTSFVAGDRFSFSVALPSLRTTTWLAGSTALTMMELFADALADIDGVNAELAKGGFNSLASGRWLEMLAAELYLNAKLFGTKTQGTVRLTAAAGAGPYSIVAGQVWVSTAGGVRFVNTAAGTLPLAGTLDLTFEAELSGTGHNVANATITVLQTALAGVTVNNPDPGSGSWITIQGTDDESDAALQERDRQKWPTLAVAANDDGYERFAKDATAPGSGVTQVTRARASASVATPGRVDLLVAGSAGAVNGATVTAVQTYVDARTALTSVVVVASAVNKAITITGTVKVKTAQAATAQAAAEADLAALASGTDIGAAEGVPLEFILAAITGPLAADGSNSRGITNMSLSAPSADVALAATEVPTFTLNLTWTSV